MTDGSCRLLEAPVPEQDNTSLSEALKAARTGLSMTLADVGSALGLANGNFVGMVERGERTPSDQRLVDLAGILGLDSRQLLTMKYKGSHPTAFGVLLQAPTARFPRLRKLLLASCESSETLAEEFRQAPYGLFERLVFQALLEHVLIPAIQKDRYAPRRLREHVATHRQLHPEQPMSADTFEQEAETFVPWVRGELPMLTWRLDPKQLQLHLSRGPGEGQTWSLSLTGREEAHSSHVQDASKRRRAAGDSQDGEGPGLRELLAEQGLGAEEVSEILDLIEWKKVRRKQQIEENS